MKTLKEIMEPDGSCACNGCNEGWGFCSTKELRQAAIEWIKELDGQFDDEIGDTVNNACLRHTQLFIKHFFNIAEEELK